MSFISKSNINNPARSKSTVLSAFTTGVSIAAIGALSMTAPTLASAKTIQPSSANYSFTVEDKYKGKSRIHCYLVTANQTLPYVISLGWLRTTDSVLKSTEPKKKKKHHLIPRVKLHLPASDLSQSPRKNQPRHRLRSVQQSKR